MKIRIKNLRLRTVIGIYEWERKIKQDVILNVEILFDGTAASKSDRIEHTVDYKKITKAIISTVEQSEFYLLESLADQVLKIVLEDPKVQKARVEIDKPQALRYTDSVSVEVEASRP